eukprot:Phypoly_transcript_04568.p2 GENE.Phypoly_transcript_04568~~Phypoly_transcript_04568.p2  ORF type:complete len:259 (+),score=35.80 Phypoly_transcript_04568:281-1057(+)
MRELDESGKNVSIIDFSTQNFTLVYSHSSATNLSWEYSATLINRAVVNITFIQFVQDSTYTFAGKTEKFPANSVKLNFLVSNWPFRAISNKLNIEMESGATAQGGATSPPSDKCHDDVASGTSYNTDTGGNLQWVKISRNGVAVYVQFVPDAMIDGRKQDITFSLLGDFTFAATFPHFWTFAELDPNFNVLLDPISYYDCAKKSSHKTKVAIIASTVTIVGLLLIVAIIVVIYKTQLRKREHKRLINMHSMSSSKLSQ